jgi:hypothetical protein
MASLGSGSTLAALVKAKAQVAKTAIALGLTPNPAAGPIRGGMPTNNAVSLKPPAQDADMLMATRKFFEDLGG